MATDTPPQDPPTPPADPNQPSNVGGLRALVREVVAEIVPDVLKGQSTKDPVAPPATDQPADIKAEVQKALGIIKAKEQREARDKQIDELLAGYKKPADTQPVERSKIHKIMGWGE
jgi:hypothetical protein